VIAGLQRAGLETTVEAFEPVGGPTSHLLESSLTQLINDIETASEPIQLILDDYHLIKSETIHNALAYLINHMPSTMHLTLATRADPPLPLARLRAQGQLVELRAADLSFKHREAARFLAHLSGIMLSEEDVKALILKTEGWIAGLQLAAISLREHDDPEAFVKAFSGSHEYIVDYLTDEVLKGRPAEQRRFLLQTSILDQLIGPLCDAVTGQSGSRAMLESLAEANLFVLPLDNIREWYRYHALFKDLLMQRLNQSEPESVPYLHRRASQWFEANALPAMAVDHALQAEDYDQAVAVLESIAEETLIRTELSIFLKWVKAIPYELIRVRPQLCVFYASAALASGADPDTVLGILDDAVASRPDANILGEVAFIRSALAMLQGDVKTSITQSQKALEVLPEDNLFLRSLGISNLGMGYMLSGDVEAASAMFTRAAEKGEKSGSYMSSLMAMRPLAEVTILKGELQEAWAVCERGLRIARGKGGKPLPVAGIMMGLQAALLREWNELERARELAEAGLELEQGWSVLVAADDYITLARVRQSQGDARGAAEAMSKASQMAARAESSRFAPILISLHQARLWVLQGDRAALEGWEQAHVPLDARLNARGLDPSFHQHQLELEGLTVARVWLALDRAGEALDLLRPLLKNAKERRRFGSAVEILMLMALAHQGRGDDVRALASLSEALELAQPQGYVRMFIDEGEPMHRLLKGLQEAGGPPDARTKYVNRLLAALVADMVPPVGPAAGGGVYGPDEPLSRRELEVLHLLATPLTSAEIAKELYISPNTARFHIKNIYSKLGVHSRAEAVEHAKQLGLI
ncbi:MAG: LuxR C-terminal-related transcriptional regulator, partial [Anaerolineales bacterium]|nr:LuxR C-terminal-related transcriptional regulator [Anaerolineales bacterium]